MRCMSSTSTLISLIYPSHKVTLHRLEDPHYIRQFNQVISTRLSNVGEFRFSLTGDVVVSRNECDHCHSILLILFSSFYFQRDKSYNYNNYERICCGFQVSFWAWCNDLSINIAGRGECVHADPNKHMCWEPDSCGEDRPFMCRAPVDRAKSEHCNIPLCTSLRQRQAS